MTEIATLYDDLLPAATDREAIERDYPAMIGLAREILGVYANAYSILNIWPPGFRTYNLMVPNFTNIPFSLVGLGPPKDLLGMAMFEASRAAGCSYCTAHSCAFALRRGAKRDEMVGDGSERASAVAGFAHGLARVPGTLTNEDLKNLQRFVSARDSEWLALGVAMMGFLNKFMDATGMALEAQIVSDVGGLLEAAGWQAGKHGGPEAPAGSQPPPVDSFATYWRILRLAPSALRLEGRWTKGVPSIGKAAGVYLEARTGYAFPVLERLTHGRAIRATATILRDNLDAAESACGLAVKPLAAFVYAAEVRDDEIMRSARALAARHGGGTGNVEADSETLAEFQSLAVPARVQMDFLTDRLSLSPAHACCLVLARAAAPTPATPDSDVLRLVRETLQPAQTVEIMTWLSVLQLLHRLKVYVAALSGDDKAG
jgi:hypothetical protein